VHGPSVAHPGLPIMNTSPPVVLAGLVVALVVTLQACSDLLGPGGGADLTVIGDDAVVLGAPVTVTAKLVDSRGRPLVGRDVAWSSYLLVMTNLPNIVGERDLGTTATDAEGVAALHLVAPVVGQHVVVAAFRDTAVARSIQVTAPTTPHPTLRWEPVTPMPSRREAQSAVSLDGLIYLVGGYCSYSPWLLPEDPCPDRSMFIYDPAADAWWEGAAPAATGAGVAAAVAGRIHFLAWDGWGAVTHERYDPDLHAWTVLDPPPDRAGVLHAVGDLLYMVGATGATWAFDPASGVWSTRAPLITPRMYAASTVLDGRIYVAGGQDWNGHASSSVGITSHERYDPATNSWSTVAPLPFPRRGFAAGVLHNKICVFGGGLQTNVWVQSWPETWCYDPAADAWDFGPLMLHETYTWAGDGVAGIGHGSAIYGFGGSWSSYKLWVSQQTDAARRLIPR
jgi:hypothetical protein